MSKNVRMPNGQLVKFGDDYSDDEIRQWIAARFPDIAKPTQQPSPSQATPNTGRGLFGVGLDAWTRGWGQTGITFQDLIPAMFQHMRGNDAKSQADLQAAQDAQNALQQKYPTAVPSIKDIHGFGDALNYGAEAVGGTLPSLVQSAGGALAGGLAGGAVAGPPGAIAGGLAGGALASGATNIPETFQNIYQATGKESTGATLLFGGLKTALDTVLPAKIGGRLFTGIVGKQLETAVLGKLAEKFVSAQGGSLVGRMALGGLKDAALEGTTEGAQAALDLVAEKFVDQNQHLFTSDHFWNVVDNAIQGAVGGGVAGGASHGVAGHEHPLVATPEQEQQARVQALLQQQQTAQSQMGGFRPTRDASGVATGFQGYGLEGELARRQAAAVQPGLPGSVAPGQPGYLLNEAQRSVQTGEVDPETGAFVSKLLGVPTQADLNERQAATGDLFGSPQLGNPSTIGWTDAHAQASRQAAFERQIARQKAFEAQRQSVVNPEIAALLQMRQDAAANSQLRPNSPAVQAASRRSDLSTQIGNQQTTEAARQITAPEGLPNSKPRFIDPEQLSSAQRTSLALKGFTDEKPIPYDVAARELGQETADRLLKQAPKYATIASKPLSGAKDETPTTDLATEEDLSKVPTATLSQRKADLETKINGLSKQLSDITNGFTKYGDAGQKAARQVQAVFADPRMPWEKKLAAFTYGHMVAKNLPSGSKVDLALHDLIHVGSNEAASAKASGDATATNAAGAFTGNKDPLRGLIELALTQSPEHTAAAVAGHEVGHAIQQYLGATDPTSVKVLERQFGKMDGPATKKLTKGVQRLLSGWKMSDGRSASDYVAGRHKKGITGNELMAYTLGAYLDAKNYGHNTNGSVMPGVRRLFNAIGDLKEKVGNALRGLGFKSARDVFEKVGGTSAKADKKTASVSAITYKKRAKIEATAYKSIPAATKVSEGATSASIPRHDLIGRTLIQADSGKRFKVDRLSPDGTKVVLRHPETKMSVTLGLEDLKRKLANPTGPWSYDHSEVLGRSLAVRASATPGSLPSKLLYDDQTRYDFGKITINKKQMPVRLEYGFQDDKGKKGFGYQHVMRHAGEIHGATNGKYQTSRGIDMGRLVQDITTYGKPSEETADKVSYTYADPEFRHPIKGVFTKHANKDFASVQTIHPIEPKTGPRTTGKQFSTLTNGQDTLRPHFAVATAAAHRVDQFLTKLGRHPYIQWGIEHFQDYMVPVHRLADQIKESGGRISDYSDPILAETLYYGRAGEKIKLSEKQFWQPIVDRLTEAGVKLPQFDEYLYARHAEERNNYLKDAGSTVTDPSGMSKKEADEILKRWRGNTAIRDAADLVDRAVKETNRVRVDGGLLPVSYLTDNNFDHYVPLRGWEDEPDSDLADEMMRTGNGFNIKRKEDRSAYGRSTRAGDILAHTMMQHNEAVIRAEKNRVAQSMLNLLADNPDPLLYDINPVEMEPYKVGGMIRYRFKNDFTDPRKYFHVKRDGQVYTIRFHDPSIAEALNNVGGTTLHPIMTFMSKFNRLMANLATQWNPEFIISNFARDLQTAGFNLKQYDNIQPRKVITDVPAALKALRGVIRNTTSGDPAWRRYADEFFGAGGSTEFLGMNTLGDHRSELAKMFRQAAPESRFQNARNFVDKMKGVLEDYNSVVENGIRLSTYKNLREAGFTQDRAAEAAKNLTVNFNKKGKWGPFLNSMYLFYNASMQGSMVMLRALRNPKVAKSALGAVMMGAVLDTINRMVSDDDDKGQKYWDSIQEYKKQNSLVLLNPVTGKDVYFQFPLPYGYNLFWNLGRHLSSVMWGAEKPITGALHAASTAVNAFNPLGSSGGFLSWVMPTWADPVVELSTNKDWTGQPIKPQQNPYGPPKPDSQLYWSNTGAIPKDIASFLHNISGGTNVRSGMLEVSPETLKYLYSYFTGATGQFVSRMGNLGSKAFTLDFQDLEYNDLPFVRKLFSEKGTRADQEYFNSALQDTELSIAGLKKAVKDGDTEEAARIRKEEGAQLRLAKPMDTISQRIGDLKSTQKKIRDNSRMAPDEKQKRIDTIKAKIAVLQTRGNSLYYKNVESQGLQPTF